MKKTWRQLAAGWLVIGMAAGVVSAAPAPAVGDSGANELAAAGLEHFERRIRPVLVERCYSCHSQESEKIKGGLLLDTREGLLKGGESGPALAPGKPEESLLIRALRYKDEHLQMPPKEKLPSSVIADFEAWVRMGAPDPRASTGNVGNPKPGIDLVKGAAFWSFKPPKIHPLPQVRRHEWTARRIDFFVLSKLEAADLAPSARADARILIRRAAFDLTGLPPSEEDVEKFEGDFGARAYEKLIERLLASPAYGERWARVWLDKARYTDSLPGFESNRGSPWLYRDWVIRAFQEGMPYNEFVKRQLAADLMPEAGPNEMPALGFLGLSPTYWKELKLQKSLIQTVVAEEWEERMDALGRTFLGLTLACARCHDHKYDPITQEDYYAVAGVLASSRMTDRPLIPETEYEPVRRARQEAGKIEGELRDLRGKKDKGAEEEKEAVKKQIAALQARAAEIKASTPGYDQPLANAVMESALYVLEDGPNHTKLDHRPGEARDLRVHLRGNPSTEGPVVPRGFLQVFSPSGRKRFEKGSGRLELAESLVGEGAALSARVMVNRVWEQHFGRGLVETPSNFGLRGERPSHPELLDDLTARFIENGWSLKWLHREVMLSSAYQQTSAYDAAKQRKDPGNRLLWRMNRRRLDVESWRDSLLMAAGNMDGRAGGAPRELSDMTNTRRTVYGTINRTTVNDLLRLYDFPDPSIHGEQRVPTTTPIQQLFVLNSEFLRRQAEELGRRLNEVGGADWEARVRQAHRWVLGRDATAADLALAKEFLGIQGETGASNEEERWHPYLHALLSCNEFMFID